MRNLSLNIFCVKIILVFVEVYIMYQKTYCTSQTSPNYLHILSRLFSTYNTRMKLLKKCILGAGKSYAQMTIYLHLAFRFLRKGFHSY